jgi:uncharacterized protein (DUF1330 family)
MEERKTTLVINAIINKENAAELQTYLGNIMPVFIKNGAVPIGRYKATDRLDGQQGSDIIAIFQFPDAEAIKTTINSESFKALAELRARVFSKLDMTICSEM